MTTLFANRALLPTGFMDNVRITIATDGEIARVESGLTPAPGDALADTLIPGIPNLHSHSFQRATAGLAEQTTGGSDTFWTWRTLMYELANKLRPVDVLAIASQLYMELLKSGYTSVAEFHYIHGITDGNARQDLEMSEAILEAARQTGIGLTLLPVLYEVSGFGASAPHPDQMTFRHTPQAFTELVEKLQQKTKGETNIGLGMAFHSLRAVKPESLAEIASWATRAMPDRPVHIHIAEQEREVAECLEKLGARPVEWLLGNANVDRNWCLIHATHMTAEEIESVAKSGAVAGLCPTTEANLGDGFFDLPRWLEGGGPLGVGSDANLSTSPVEELRLLEYGSRLRERRRLVATSPEHPGTGAFLWSAAAKGGAQALGRKSGAIEIGNRADFLNLDANHPALCASSGEDILSALVFGPSQGAIRDVYVAGRRVIEDGRHDQEVQISALYRKAVRSLLEI